MQAAPMASPAPRRHPSRRQTVYTIEQRLDVGARVAAWRDDHPDVRRMCWAALARDVFHQTLTKAVTMRLKRSWHEWQLHSEHGSHTNVAAGAEHRALRRRKDDNAHDTRRRECCDYIAIADFGRFGRTIFKEITLAFAIVSDQFNGIERYPGIVAGLRSQRFLISFAKSSDTMVLERRFGQPS